tara:strand:+ start:528 stop:1445 length:918 start_codon:yes stop_codon:yes gene_type:complete
MCTRVAPGVFQSENASNDPKQSHLLGNTWKRKIHLQGEPEKKCQGNGYLLWKENGGIYTLTGTPSNPVIYYWNPEDKKFKMKGTVAKKAQANQMASRIARGGTLEEMRIDLISCIPQRPAPAREPAPVVQRSGKDDPIRKLEKFKAKKLKMMDEIAKLKDELKKQKENHRLERQEQERRHRGEMKKHEDNHRRELQEQEEKHRRDLNEEKEKHQIHLEKVNELLTEIDSSEEEEWAERYPDFDISSDEDEDEQIIFEGVDYLLDESDNTVIDAEDFEIMGKWNRETKTIEFEDDEARQKHLDRLA